MELPTVFSDNAGFIFIKCTDPSKCCYILNNWCLLYIRLQSIQLAITNIYNAVYSSEAVKFDAMNPIQI